MSLAPSAPDVPANAFTSFASSPALAIWFDDRIFERAKQISTYLSKADGFAPPHLLGKPEACFAVVERSLTWRLSPYAVAQSTYQTPGGKVGFEGKLCQAILENSGRLDGGIEYEHYYDIVFQEDGRSLPTVLRSNTQQAKEFLEAGVPVVERRDWRRIQGKFAKRKSEKGKEYAVPAWKDEDEAGLGVAVKALIRGEKQQRVFEFDLIQAFPRNSTLWATDPMTQICYLAVRRFASVRAPGIFMGVPFDREDEDPAIMARDVTPPRPSRSDFDEPPPSGAPASAPVQEITPEDEAEADRLAQRFAETGTAEPEEVDETAGGEAASDTSAASHDPETGEIIEATTTDTVTEPRNPFWERGSYEIVVPQTAKGSPHFPNWDTSVRRAISDALTSEELVKLDVDNAKSMQAYQLRQPDGAKALRATFVDRRNQLAGQG